MKLVSSLAVGLLVIPTLALGKCPTEHVVVQGFVIDESSAPLSQKQFLAEWLSHDGEVQQIKGVTESDGSYEIAIPFTTYSGQGLTGDRCDAKLTEITLHFHADNMQFPVLLTGHETKHDIQWGPK